MKLQKIILSKLDAGITQSGHILKFLVIHSLFCDRCAQVHQDDDVSLLNNRDRALIVANHRKRLRSDFPF